MTRGEFEYLVYCVQTCWVDGNEMTVLSQVFALPFSLKLGLKHDDENLAKEFWIEYSEQNQEWFYCESREQVNLTWETPS